MFSPYEYYYYTYFQNFYKYFSIQLHVITKIKRRITAAELSPIPHMMSSNASATVRPKRKRDGTALLTSSPYSSEVKSKLDSKKKLIDEDCLATPMSKTKWEMHNKITDVTKIKVSSAID